MPNKFYPFTIAALLGAFILFLLWSGFQASTSGTEITDRDYYSKGLKYNSTQVEKRAAESRGWQLATRLVNGEIRFQLSDGTQQQVRGAQGRLKLFATPTNDLLTLPLQEVEAGSYRAQLPATLRGEVSVRVEFEQNGARLSRQLLLNI